MGISSGTRLGPYEVVSPLGSGGMGEVWKARDTRLDRSVAIKVLPADFAGNAQLKTRFEREAKTISQLNHPHICTLYDVGDGYLVMELLEGESLADRLARGALPIDQVLRYGIEIATALEKAHKAGIVHRDLKPGNIMITKTGAKLLDFGLAKPVAVFDAGAATEHKPLTQEGAIVGTFQYMAPEQIEGGNLDARTDIFAFGAVLYEMATGRRAFEGKSKASLIANILTAEPQPVGAIQPMTPAAFDRLVRTCLAKDPDQRWQSAHDIAMELRWMQTPESVAKRRASTATLAWMIAIAALIGASVFAWLWRTRGAGDSSPRVVQTLILPPAKSVFQILGAGAPPAISADGSKIVFGASESGKPRQLFVRSLDAIVARALAGTDDAMFPFWSPDGNSIGFFTADALKRIEVNGGAAILICSVVDGRGGSWSPDGQTIVFAGRFTGIQRVSASGGAPSPVTTLENDSTTHRFPDFLPDGKHFVYLSSRTGGHDATNAIWVGSLDGAVAKKLIGNTDEPHYLDGAIIFNRDQILYAQAFDPNALTISGDPVPLREQRVNLASNFSRSIVTVARNGTLVYQTGELARESQLTWFDRAGKPLGTVGEPGSYMSVSLSPDGRTVIGGTANESNVKSNVWSFDVQMGTKGRTTFGDSYDYAPVWAPDGKRVIYASIIGRQAFIKERDVTTGADRTLWSKDLEFGNPSPSSWSPDGKAVLFTVVGRATRNDIHWLSLDDLKDHTYAETPAIETGARFSPDGKWVAYQSTETGPGEIYIAPFPPTGAKWQVSDGGGVAVRWNANGRELFYSAPRTGTLMAVSVMFGVVPQIGKATPLFSFHAGAPNPSMYDVAADGSRFLINARVGEPAPPEPLILVQGFDSEVRAALKR